MKLHNYELEHFHKFLMSLKLVDYRSRQRTKFARLVEEKYKEYHQDLNELIVEHVQLDDDGKPISIEVEGGMKFEIKNPSEFQLAQINLGAEEVIIEKTEERKNMFESVRESILNCGKEFEGKEAILYDRWCEIVES